MRARMVLGIVVASLAFGAPLLAQSEPPQPAPLNAPSAPETTLSSSAFKIGRLVRPAMVGLVAALFLVCGALVGANDKHKQAKHRR